MQVEEAEVGGGDDHYTWGKCWGDICGLLEKAMGRTDRKDQESNREAGPGGREDLEGERTWRRGWGQGCWGSRQLHLSTCLLTGNGNPISDG